jgi:hypothetical protein
MAVLGAQPFLSFPLTLHKKKVLLCSFYLQTMVSFSRVRNGDEIFGETAKRVSAAKDIRFLVCCSYYSVPFPRHSTPGLCRPDGHTWFAPCVHLCHMPYPQMADIDELEVI